MSRIFRSLRADTDAGLALRVFLANKLLVVFVTVVANWEGWKRLLTLDMAYEVLVYNFRFFDSGWYVGIADHGYQTLKESAFFPLYPSLMGLVGRLLHLGYLTSGVLVSNLAFAALLFFFARLARHDLGASASRRAVWMLGLFPTAFYFSAAYTEALFALATVVSLLAMRRRRWATAGIAGGLAALTRNMGVLLIIPFLIEFGSALRENGVRARDLLSRAGPWRRSTGVLWVLPVCGGAAAYVLFLWWRFGEPFAFAKTQALYGRETLAPWLTLYHGYRHGLAKLASVGLPIDWSHFYFGLELVIVSLVIVVLVASAGRIRWSYWSIIFYSLLIPLSGPSTVGYVDYFISFPRYAVVILPLFLGLAVLLRDHRAFRAYLAVSASLLVVLLYAWSMHLWVA